MTLASKPASATFPVHRAAKAFLSSSEAGWLLISRILNLAPALALGLAFANISASRRMTELSVLVALLYVSRAAVHALCGSEDEYFNCSRSIASAVSRVSPPK